MLDLDSGKDAGGDARRGARGVDEPLLSIDLASPLRTPPRRPPLHRRSTDEGGPRTKRGVRWLGRLVLVVLMVAAGVRGALWVLPEGLPIAASFAPFLHPLPDGAFGVFALALGVGAVSVFVAALRQSPIAWGLMVTSAGAAALAWGAVAWAAELAVGPPVPLILRVGASAVAGGLGLLGLQWLAAARPPSGNRALVAFGLCVAGGYFAITLARSTMPSPPRASPGELPRVLESPGTTTP